MIRLADIFQSGMVLQRGKPLALWGESDRAQRVAVFLNRSPLTTLSIAGPGAFRAELPALEAAEGAELRFRCEDGQDLTLENVDIGEVWIAGGQSNMEFFLCYDAEAPEVLAGADDPHLRSYTVARYAFDEEAQDGFKDDGDWNRWLPATPENAPHFSAVGWYFARKLREALRVPVGIVNCNWGGTTASTWLDESFLRQDAALSVYLDDFAQATAGQDAARYRAEDRAFRGRKPVYRDRLNIYKMYGSHRLWCKFLEKYICSGPIQPMGSLHHNAPGRLYQSMLRKIVPYTCKGVLWYQGESDMHHAEVYARLFTALIGCWRRDWGEELPFLFVQLAPFDRDCGFVASGFPEIRRQQEAVEKAVPNVWMTSIMDIGMAHDIHPKKKRPVGERLALLARAKVYGEHILSQEPQLRAARRSKNGVRLEFDHAGEGLFLAGKRLNGLSVFADGVPVRRWRAETDADALCVRARLIGQAERIRVEFAETPYCQVNLYNSAGLPARPFSCEISGGIK